jgi:uncharacterized membrane protein
MSVSALTTLAAVRDVRAPTKRDVGKEAQPQQDPAKEAQASLTDLLVTLVPTELVAPYTALTAAIVGSVAEATAKVPKPEQYEGWRWFVFVVLLVGTAGVVWNGKRVKSTAKRFPLLEISAAVVAATGWALALPSSPLIPELHGNSRIFVPLVIAFVAIVILAVLGQNLTKKANTS